MNIIKDSIRVQLPVLKLGICFFLYFSYHSGVILDSKVFDTYGIISAGRNLRDYLNNIKGKYVILFQGQVDRRPISINPRLNCNLGFFILFFKTPFGLIFCVLFRASNSHILDKKKFDWIFFKALRSESYFTLTLGYLNPASNNPALVFRCSLKGN